MQRDHTTFDKTRRTPTNKSHIMRLYRDTTCCSVGYINNFDVLTIRCHGISSCYRDPIVINY